MQHEEVNGSECCSQVSFKPKLVQAASINLYKRHSSDQPRSRDLTWQDFRLKGYADRETTRDEVNEACAENADRMVNVGQYMVETPFFVQTGDRITRVLDLFRAMNLKLLPVVDYNFSSSEAPIRGIITRQDLFMHGKNE